MELTKQIPHTNMDSIESFLVDLGDMTNYRLLSLSTIAQHLLETLKREEK
jgi:hypothetical protein